MVNDIKGLLKILSDDNQSIGEKLESFLKALAIVGSLGFYVTAFKDKDFSPVLKSISLEHFDFENNEIMLMKNNKLSKRASKYYFVSSRKQDKLMWIHPKNTIVFCTEGVFKNVTRVKRKLQRISQWEQRFALPTNKPVNK